jgi:hypothetical protein
MLLIKAAKLERPGESSGLYFFPTHKDEIPTLSTSGRFFFNLVCIKTVILPASQLPIHQKKR